MLPPTRLVQDTDKMRNLIQGISHDENGRAVSYRFRKSGEPFGFECVDYPAFGKTGLPIVSHIMDPECTSGARGVSPACACNQEDIAVGQA